MKFLDKDGVTYLWGKIKTALNGKQDTLTFDNAPTANSDNPVKSGGIKEALDGKKNTQSAVSSPSASGNALAFIDTISQNEQGVIAATKKSVTVDTTPTANSTNPVQSGGVKAALDGKQNTLTLPLAVSQGGTGATTGYDALFKLGLARGTVNTFGKVPISNLSECVVLCSEGGAISDGPYPTSTAPQWWEVLCVAQANNRVLEIASQVYSGQPGKDELWIRSRHDTYWSRWTCLAKRAITANMGTVTGTGSTVTVTKNVAGVTSNMTVDRIEFGTPSAVQSGWTVTTATNSVTFSATINGSTTVKIKLSDNTNVTGM